MTPMTGWTATRGLASSGKRRLVSSSEWTDAADALTKKDLRGLVKLLAQLLELRFSAMQSPHSTTQGGPVVDVGSPWRDAAGQDVAETKNGRMPCVIRKHERVDRRSYQPGKQHVPSHHTSAPPADIGIAPAVGRTLSQKRGGPNSDDIAKIAQRSSGPDFSHFRVDTVI